MRKLPPNPPTIRALTDGERELLISFYPDLQKSLSDCRTCRGRKSFRWLHDGEPTEFECDCVGQFRLHRYLLHLGIDYSYQRLSWDDAEHVEKAALDKVFDYADHADGYINAGIGLVLHGTMGSGKTLVTTLLLRRMAKDGHDVYFTTFQHLIDCYTGGWRDEEKKAWFDRRIRNAGALGIDDLGRENKNRIEVVEAMLDEVLRSRVSAARPTIITTNKTLNELKSIYRSNVMSLLAESSIEHEFSGEDYRTTAKDARIVEAQAGLSRPIVLQ